MGPSWLSGMADDQNICRHCGHVPRRKRGAAQWRHDALILLGMREAALDRRGEPRGPVIPTIVARTARKGAANNAIRRKLLPGIAMIGSYCLIEGAPIV